MITATYDTLKRSIEILQLTTNHQTNAGFTIALHYFFSTGDPIAQPYTLTQGKSLAMTAIDVFTNPELLQKIQKNFAEDIRARK